MTNAWLATREDVASALDIKSTARDFAQIDREIEAASRSVERLLHRRFAPTLDTRKFDWPNQQMGRSWDLWLDDNELISLPTAIVSGSASISPANVFLEPVNYGPPYNRLSINLGSTSAFQTGSTYQQAIAVTGLFGYTDDSRFAGTTVGTFSSVNNVAYVVEQHVGVGTVLKIESERLICTDRAMADTSRVTAGPDLTASAAGTLVQTDGATIYPGEILLIDAEEMLVQDTVGNNLVVKRAWSGTALAAHTSGAHIYAQRAFTVTRGALGTVAAAHADGTTWTSWVVPGPVRDLTIAEVLAKFGKETSGYASDGGGAGASGRKMSSLDDIRAEVKTSHGRKGRQRVVV